MGLWGSAANAAGAAGRSSMGGAESGRNSSGNQDRDRDDAADRASRFSTQAERDAIARGDFTSAGKLAGLKPGEGYESLTGWERFKAGLKGIFKGSQAVAGLTSGGLATAMTGGAAAKSSMTSLTEAITGQRWHTAEGKTMMSPNAGPASPSVSNDRDRSQAGMASAVKATTQPVTAAVSTAVSNPIMDFFTMLARQKQGYQSTIKGSGSGGAAPPKSLLGE